jgi:two-component system, LuxR family, sensor kinase FixL
MRDIYRQQGNDASMADRSVHDERLSRVLDLSSEAVLIVSSKGTILAASAAADSWLRSVAPLSRNPRLIDIGTMRPLWPSLVAGIAGPGIAHFVLTLPDRHVIEGSVLALGSTADEPEFAVRLNEAAGQRSWAEQAGFAQTARQAGMSAVGTAMAHEINQPLTALLLYLQTMQRMLGKAEGEFRETFDELLGKAIRESQRAGEIVKRIRELAARKEPARRLADLEQVIDDALELSRAGRTAPIDLVRDYAAIGHARIDAVEIQQILVNLLTNAFEAVAGEKERRVTILGSRDDGQVKIAVADSGPGLPRHLIDKLFRPFESTKENGLGIGLSISQAIAHAHGGNLSVDPGGGGRGATFTLILPIGEDGDDEPSRLSRARSSAPTERVLP